MVTLFYLLSLLEILFILESMESRFLLLKLEDPALEVDAPDIGKSNPFLPETIGSYYSNIIIIFYLLCHFIYVFHLSDVSLVSIFFDGNYHMFFIFMFQPEVLVEREFYVQEDVAAT